MPIGEGDPQAVRSQVIVVAHLAHRVRCRARCPALREELIADRVPILSHAQRVVDLAIHERQRSSGERIASPGPTRAELDVPNVPGIEIQRALHVDDQ